MTYSHETIPANDTLETLQRAGFWQRLIAALIDGLIVTLPLQILVVVLFAQTNGAIQSKFGFTTTYCEATQLPDSVISTTQIAFTSVKECKVYSFGFESARYLLITNESVTDSRKNVVFQARGLRSDGQQLDAYFVDWVAYLLLFSYLIFMEHHFGRTLGKKVLSIRTIDVKTPSLTGISLSKAFLRPLVMLIGLIPGTAIGVIAISKNLASPHVPFAVTDLFIVSSIFSGLVVWAWLIWITVSVSKKRDPIYDRLMGTAVVMARG